jgi:two-component system CheB/CheR fusion protein
MTDQYDEGFDAGPGFEELLSYLSESRGFDFTGYKRTGLARRLSKRTAALALSSYFEYVDYLQVHPDEFGHLFNTILINATGFFRDPTAWEYVAEQVVPRLIAAKNGAPIRAWSAGCATGQEAYSLAMLLAEALGLEAFSRQVKIYATDIDDDALGKARQAIYAPKEVVGVPVQLHEKYFERVAGKSVFLKEIRRAVIFGRHNLLYDAPISRIDLLLCRNTLMYFNADSQARILSSLHFALADAGVLFLGKAEMLFTHSALFTPLDLKRRLFTKVTQVYPRPRSTAALNALRRTEERADRIDVGHIRAAAFETSPVPQLAIDVKGCLAVANEQARRVLGVLESEIGRPIQDLSLCRKVENLRAGIDQASTEGRTVQLSASEWLRGHGDEPQYFDILTIPLVDDDGVTQGVQVSFLDVTPSRKMQEELQQTTQELEGAYEELQSTGEELETTNEELQSTVEELETTNEELQSTNEELETTNEELQSTNEELQTMNEELRLRSGDLSRINLYFESILASLRSAVVVLDLDLCVQVWSDRAQELWGLRSDEVRGKHFLNLDIGLPSEQLMTRIRACLDGSGAPEYEQITLAATNRRGRSIRCDVLVSRLNQDNTSQGIILLMDERDLQSVPVTVEHDA